MMISRLEMIGVDGRETMSDGCFSSSLKDEGRLKISH